MATTSAPSRFAPAREPRVRAALRELFSHHGASTLVASGACGADVIAHEVAGELGMRRVLLLPTDVTVFRATSVTDRGAGWGERFDRLVYDVTLLGDVRILRLDASLKSYLQLNETLLDVAQGIAQGIAQPTAKHAGVLAVAVWDGVSYGDEDVSAAFVHAARRREIAIAEIATT